MPTQIGECVETRVRSVGNGSRTRPGSGSAISFAEWRATRCPMSRCRRSTIARRRCRDDVPCPHPERLSAGRQSRPQIPHHKQKDRADLDLARRGAWVRRRLSFSGRRCRTPERPRRFPRHSVFRKVASRIKPSGQGPWPDAVLMWPASPASTSVEPQAFAFASASAKEP